MSDDLPEEILESFVRLQRCLAEIQQADSKTAPTNFFIATSHKFQITKDLAFLRNSCAKGTRVQDFIISTSDCLEIILQFLSPNSKILACFDVDDRLEVERLVWQFAANLCVMNSNCQAIVLENLGDLIVKHCLARDINALTDIQLMILYNIFKGNNSKFDEEKAFEIIVCVWEKVLNERSKDKLVFLHLFFEHFLVEYQWTIRIYAKLEAEKRISVLKYIHTYVQNENPNGAIRSIMLDFISKEFKKKSDHILKAVDEADVNLHPQEVLALLKVIATASGSELYVPVYEKDHSLFLNAGGLLKNLIAVGKEPNNIFTPMQKLTEVAPCSKIDTDFELEVSFELKTLLVRTLANLLYKNAKNQEYARELGIISGILDCTNVDARNPLVKEWSILAIRNLCDACPENQEIISKLSKVGDAPNDALKELNIDLGSLRIQPGQ